MTEQETRRCHQCEDPLVPHHDTWFCLRCDNRAGLTQASWALNWADEYEDGDS